MLMYERRAAREGQKGEGAPVKKGHRNVFIFFLPTNI